MKLWWNRERLRVKYKSGRGDEDLIISAWLVLLVTAAVVLIQCSIPLSLSLSLHPHGQLQQMGALSHDPWTHPQT